MFIYICISHQIPGSRPATVHSTLQPTGFPSSLFWKASFIHPDHSTLKQESKALQLLTNGPFNAIPKDLLYNLKQVGLPAQAHSLRTTSLASRSRNALYRMHNYHDNIKLLQDHYLHDG